MKVKHQKLGGLTQEIYIPILKWEVINMEFIASQYRTLRQHDSIWVIADGLTMYTHILDVKSTHSVKDYTKL